MGIGDYGIMRYNRKAFVTQIVDYGFDLVGQPHVILVTNEDIVALRMSQGVFEIGRVASLALIENNAYARITKCPDDIESAIGGAVV